MSLAILRNITLLAIATSVVACTLNLSEQSSVPVSESAKLFAEGKANLSEGNKQAIGVAQLKRAAELGESEAYGELAFFYIFMASPQDIEQGVRYAQEGAAMHDSYSLYVLGLAYCIRRVSGQTPSQGLVLITRGLNEVNEGNYLTTLMCAAAETCATVIAYENINGVGSVRDASLSNLMAIGSHVNFYHPKCK